MCSCNSLQSEHEFELPTLQNMMEKNQYHNTLTCLNNLLHICFENLEKLFHSNTVQLKDSRLNNF